MITSDFNVKFKSLLMPSTKIKFSIARIHLIDANSKSTVDSILPVLDFQISNELKLKSILSNFAVIFY